jgi:hypothetical protein
VVSGTTGESVALASLFGQRGLRQRLSWRERQVRELLWPLFSRSTWAQPAPVVAARQVRAMLWPLFLCQSGLIQPLCWRARQVRALLWPLYVRSAWAQAATAVAGTTGEGAALASVLSVGVGSARHCVGGHDR